MDILNMIKNFFLVTWQRIKSDTPRYWRRVSMIGLFLSAAAGFLTENDAIIPEQYKYITKYVTAMSLAIAAVSRLATANTELATKSDDVLLKENADKKIDNI